MRLSLSIIIFLSFSTYIDTLLAESNPIAQGVIQAEGLGTVDTSKVKNSIQAKIMAKRAATVDAQRNLLEMVEGVRITSGTTVKDAQLESDIVANRVKGLLKGAFVMKQKVSKDEGTYLAEVTLGLCLNASVANCKARPNLAQIIYQSLPKTPAEDKFIPTSQTSTAAGDTTSLIIDLSEQQFTPYLDIRVVTNTGKEVYGPGSFKPTSNTDWVHWEKTMAAAQNSPVAGDKPMVITATGTTLDSDIILSSEDANKIYAANLDSGDFLGQGKVIFVTR